MPVLAAATLELNADSARLEADLGRTVAMATTWGTMIGTVLGNAITAAAKKLEAMVSRAIETADAADKMTQKLGVSAEWFGVTAASAELANVSVASLSQGMKMLAVNAQTGGGKAGEAFRAMGIDAKAFGNDTQGLFDEVMRKLAGYEDGANKVALANALMGRSGSELIPMANELEKNRKLAQELGIAMSAQTNAAAAQFKDNMKAGSLAAEAMGMRIMEVLLPSLVKLSGFLVENAKNTERLEGAVRVAETGLKIIGTAAVLTAQAFSILGGMIASTARSLIEFGSGNFKGAIQQVVEGSLDVGAKLHQTAGDIGAIWEETSNKIAAGAEETSKKIAAPALLAAEKVKSSKLEFNEFRDAIMQVYNDAANAALADQEIEKRAADARNQSMEESARYAKALADFREGRMGEEEQLATRVQTVAVETKKADDVGRRFGMTFSSAFERAVISGSKFADVLRSLTQDVAQLILRMTVTEPIARSIQGSFSGFGSGGFGRGGAGAAGAGAEGSYGFEGFAEGGRPPMGRASIVGERGPELFQPDTAGTIIPNNQLGGVHIVNNVSVAPGGVSAAEVRHALAVTQRQTISAVQELGRR